MAEKRNDTVDIEFRVHQSMVDAFARITGDYNSMHMDPEVARKSKFRETVVHGMISFSFLQFLQHSFPDRQVEFNGLNTKFVKPIFVGNNVKLSIDFELDDLKGSFKAIWRSPETNQVLIRSSGEFDLFPLENGNSIGSGGNENSFLQKGVTENKYSIEDLKDQIEKIEFTVSGKLQSEYVDLILNAGVLNYGPLDSISNNLCAVFMLSTIVGMRLPGRYAIFERFKIKFSKNLKTRNRSLVTSKLSDVSVPTQSMNAEIRIETGSTIATGSLGVLLHSAPRKMLSSADIYQQHLDLGLNNKVVLITGASRGIGETTAKLFGAFGSKVIVNYFRGERDAQAVVEDIESAGGQATKIQCDITNDHSVKSMISQAVDKFGKINILVNNAVFDASPKQLIDMSWEDFQPEIDVTLKGLHLCCKEVVPILKLNGGGKIINLSSVYVDNPVSGQGRYITTKSAVNGYTKSLAKELVDNNIQVNIVVPNMSDTDLVSVLPSMFKDKIAQSRPYKRHVHPIEVAHSIAFLASQWANAITGQKIVVNLGEPPFA